MRIDIPNFDCYSQLWLSVLQRAVEDATMETPPPRPHYHTSECRPGCKKVLRTEEHMAQEKAREWFASTSDDVCSFEWLCSVLNLEPEVLRRELRRRTEAAAHDGGPRLYDDSGESAGPVF